MLNEARDPLCFLYICNMTGRKKYFLLVPKLQARLWSLYHVETKIEIMLDMFFCDIFFLRFKFLMGTCLLRRCNVPCHISIHRYALPYSHSSTCICLLKIPPGRRWYVLVCLGVCPCGHMWKSEVDSRCFPQLFL